MPHVPPSPPIGLLLRNAIFLSTLQPGTGPQQGTIGVLRNSGALPKNGLRGGAATGDL